MKFNTDEIESIISILERLRKHFNITKSEIDEKAKLKAGQYGRMVTRSQKIDLESLRDICKEMYDLTITETLNLGDKSPSEESLPTTIRSLIKGRTSVRDQDRINLPSYLFLIIDKYVNVGDIIHNNVIRPYIPADLKNKAIEPDKTSIKKLVQNINEGKDGVKKQFRLIASIPLEILTKARENVDPLWLKEFEEHIKTE